jgi:transcriptional regulator with XRE-family HTH domain
MDGKGLNVEIGHKIKEIRLSRGLSQKMLGELAGITTQRVHSLEIGEMLPRLTTLVKIAEGLGISVFDILDEPLGRRCKACANSPTCPFFKPVK